MPKFTTSNLNKYLLFKLPSAYFSGVRVASISENEAIAKVKFQWINQNPFKSLYWATQGMASELVTGLLVMQEVSKSNKRISTLVTEQKGVFTKKAIGTIHFYCIEGDKISKVIEKAIETGEGQTLVLTAEGFDESNDSVSKFEYTWSVKLKSNQK